MEEYDYGGYDIINVVAADEHAENVDNNAFTNAKAISAVRFAALAAEELGIEPNPRWQIVAEGIPILEHEDGVTREHATYDGEMIKQADVKLLSYPLNMITEPDQMRKNLNYYQQRVDERGPAMTHSVYSVISSRLGDPEEAYDLFQKGFQPNKLPPFGVIAEVAGGTNPYFATGAGGMLQAVLAGFGGIEFTDEGITLRDTPLPENWESVTITGVGKDSITITNSRD